MAAPKPAAVLPTLSEVGEPGVPDLGTAARHLEELGFESVWVPDLLIGDGTPALEAAVALATAAAVTRHVRVGFSVLTLPLRPAALVAAQVQTLQHVSGNRVLLGVGSGGFPGSPFWQAVGAAVDQRGRRTDAALAVLPGLIAGAPTRVRDGSGQPVVTLAPAAPVPPILIGGNSQTAIRRAATLGDGWFPSLLTPATLAAGVAKLRELAAEQGRAAPSVTVGGHAFLGEDAATRSARDAFVRDLVEVHRIPPEEAGEVPVSGSRQQVAERLAAYAQAGADRIAIGPDGKDWLRGWEQMAEVYSLLR